MKQDLKERLNNLIKKEDFNFVKVCNQGSWVDCVMESQNFYLGFMSYSFITCAEFINTPCIKLKRKNEGYIDVSTYFDDTLVISSVIQKTLNKFIAQAATRNCQEISKQEKDIEEYLDSIGE